MKHELDPFLIHEQELRQAARSRSANDTDADDLLQDVWLAVLEAPQRRANSDKSWLMGVLRHVSVNQFRRDSARRRRERLSSRAEETESTVDIVARASLRRQLLDAMLELQAPYRKVLLLRFLSDMPPREIAQYLDENPATIRSQLKRALVLLREKLGVNEKDKRLRALAIFCPGLADRGTITTTLLQVSGAIAATIVAVVSLSYLLDDEEVIPMVEQATWVQPQPHSPRRTKTQKVEKVNPANNPRPKPPASLLAVRGQVSLLPEITGANTELEVSVQPVLSGPASNFLGLSAYDHHLRTMGPDAFRVQTTDGGKFTVPMTEPGLLTISFTSRKFPGRSQIIANHMDSKVHRHHIRLLQDIDLRLTDQDLRFQGPVRNGLGIKLTSKDIDHIQRPGPWLPGVGIPVYDASSDLTWYLRLRESQAHLGPPHVQRWCNFQLFDTRHGGPLAHVQARIRFQGRNFREWTCELPQVIDGNLRFPILDINPQSANVVLEFQFEDGTLMKVPRFQKVALALKGQFDENNIPMWISQPMSIREAEIVDQNGSPIDKVVAIRLGHSGPSSWASSNSNGQLSMSSIPPALDPAIAVVREGPRPGLYVGDPDPGKDILLWHASRGFLRLKEDQQSPWVWPNLPGRKIQFVSEVGEPLPGLEIRIRPQGIFAHERYLCRRPVKSDAKGAVRLPPIQGGSFEAMVTLGESETWIFDCAKLNDITTIPYRNLPKNKQEISIVNEQGRVLAEVRGQLRQVGSKRLIRQVSNHNGLFEFPEISIGTHYRFDILAAGRELSLRADNSVVGGSKRLQFAAIPLIDYNFQLNETPWTKSKFLGIMMEREGGRRRAIFSSQPRAYLPLTAETQELTIYRPGCRAQTIDWNPSQGRVSALLKPGPKITLRLNEDAKTGHVRLSALRIATKDRHLKPLKSALSQFQVSVEVHQQDVAIGPLTPGRYRIDYASGKAQVKSRIVEIKPDTEIVNL